MLEVLEVLVATALGHSKRHLRDAAHATRELLAEHLGHRLGVPAKDAAAKGPQQQHVVTQLVGDGEHEADTVAHRALERGRVETVVLAGAAGVGCRSHDHIGIGVVLVALEADLGHHERTVTIELAVDIAATVLGVPALEAREHVVQERTRAEGLLLRHGPAVVATARVSE